ncbi:hypothetical protein WICMUC_000867 [Wickerhamomyces mucosus]|uniref:Exocyst complex component Sec10-like alpha-helical bundle domain-containing protein n=1 Tax=Wickerhamomyces mucosus TaxID=1378264 RepID=A0A9P8PY14_9ASCO|nr:hypothetical protein WICMUC_000867 [Wickerhamomyces mucosus]
MNKLIENEDIIWNIVNNLSIESLFNFIKVNKLTHQVLIEQNSDKIVDYFANRLNQILIIYDPNYQDDLLIDYDPITIFNFNKTGNPIVKCSLILNQLSPFLDKLKNLKIEDETKFELDDFFNDNPISLQDKSKILINLQKFIEIDNADFQNFQIMNNKIQKLIKLFIKSLFDELKICFTNQEYSIVNLIVEALNILNQEELIVEFFKQENKFPLDFFPETIIDINGGLIEDSLINVLNDLDEFINNKSKIIDECFDTQLPVMLLYIEPIIEKNLIQQFLTKECDKNVENVPQIYYYLFEIFIPNLIESKNVGEIYFKLIGNFINLYFEPILINFLNQDPTNFEIESIAKLKDFNNLIKEQDELDKDVIYKNLLGEYYNNDQVKTNKFELLTNFTKIFNSKKDSTSNEINLKLNFEILNKNLQNLKSFINFEICYSIIENCRIRIKRYQMFFYKIIELSNVDQIITREKINQQIETLFIKMLIVIGQYHMKLGFEKAIEMLKKYDPTEFKSLENLETINTVEPLIKFTELINIADLIQQMVEIFYNNELIVNKLIDKDEFLNTSNQTKRTFESTLDNFVANGLNIGIDKLMDEIEFLFNTLQLPNDFNPNLKNKNSNMVQFNLGPTKCSEKIVQLLSNHINLLNGSTEKGIIDIFQQEIGERFFQIIVKNIKKRQISTDGAIILISDLNLYYDFIVNTLKQKNITPFFVGLKEIGQIYLISTDDSKELGKLIMDLSKFNGIFKQEEIYEFVQKRTDWLKIKKDVERAMYGLGLTDCCII